MGVLNNTLCARLDGMMAWAAAVRSVPGAAAVPVKLSGRAAGATGRRARALKYLNRGGECLVWGLAMYMIRVRDESAAKLSHLMHCSRWNFSRSSTMHS